MTECPDNLPLFQQHTVCLQTSRVVVGTKMVKFWIGTHVRKYTASPLQTKYNHITRWTLPLLLFIVRCFSSATTYKGFVNKVLLVPPVEPEFDLLVQVMAAAYVGLPGIGYRVYMDFSWSGVREVPVV